MSATLSIVFTGLCALVTDGDRAPAQVLLVDARGIGEVGGVVLPEHTPTLVANLRVLANAESSGPTRVVTVGSDRAAAAEPMGLWDLTGSEVRVRVQGRRGSGVELYKPLPGTSSWPEPPPAAGRDAWRDLRFLASMQALTGDGRIEPVLVEGEGTLAQGLPRGVGARIHLETGRLAADAPSPAIHADDTFELGAGARALKQALTDTVRWSLDAGRDLIVVEIVPVAGGATRRLVIAPQAGVPTLYVSNLPADGSTHEGHHAMVGVDSVAPHFGVYYKLLKNEPAEKPMPRLSLPPVAPKGVAGGRPVFCGPAVFTRR